MAVMLPYERYIRLFGIFRAEQLMTPKVRRIERLALPRGSVLHYLPENETEVGPSRDNPFLITAQRLIYIQHVTKLTAQDGGPRSTYVLPGPMIQKYRRDNMQIRPMNDYEMATKEPLNTVVINYSMLGKMFKYMRSALSLYWYWKNIRSTVWDTINSLNTPHERHHFVVMDIPKVLPTLSEIRRAEKRITPELVKIFNSRERLDILDMFTWLGNERATTPMGRLSPDKFSTTNLILRKDTGWLAVNLGKLDSWRRSVERASMEGVLDDLALMDGLSVSMASMDLDGNWVVREAEVGRVSDSAFDLVFSDGSIEVVSHDNVSLEAAGPRGLDPKILQIRFLGLLMKMIAATNPVIDNGNLINSEEEEAKDLEAAESEKQDDHEADLQILKNTTEDGLLVDEEEMLSEDLDKQAKTEEKALMTDEDGELIIESANTVAEDIPQAVGNRNIVQTLTSSIDSKLDELADKNMVSSAEYRRMQRLAKSYTVIKNPWNPEETIEQGMVITQEDLVLNTEHTAYPDTDAVKDKSMLNSTVEMMDSQYIDKVMKKDILNCVLSVQKAGIAVTGYSVKVVEDAVSNYEVHTIQLTPVTGKPSTVQVRVPVVDKRGVYVSNGQRYRLRAQKADVPICKVNPSRVALTSYYAKVFVDRSTRAVFDYDKWITNTIVKMGQDKEDTHVTELRLADVLQTLYDLPRIYAIISTRIMAFTSNGNFWFDYKNRLKSKLFTQEALDHLESKHKGWVCVGRRDKRYIMVDRNDQFYLVDMVSDRVTELGAIEDILAISKEKAPVSVAEVSIFGKVIPIGAVLGYLLGFNELLQLTKAKFRVVPLGERLQMSDDEFAVKFLDETLVFSKLDQRNALIFGGFLQYHRQTRQFSRHSFNEKDVYFNVLSENNIGLRYLRELDLMNAMFVDPITKGVLEWMKEPTEFMPLLMRACEMLTTRYVPVAVVNSDGLIDGLERAKGYERIPGAIYAEMVRSIRVYNSRSASNSSQVTMKPHEVWTNIVQDPAAALVDDINPIQNLKQKEIITYGGRGGRSSRSMTAAARLYKESDLGFISEATVDSGDVAVITYMPPNAKLSSVRGTVRTFDPSIDGASSLVSTAALISPCSDRDDPKRVNFIGIQQSHVIATKGYRESPLSTGYDSVIAQRVDDIFAATADQDGEVVEQSADHIVVQYADGSFVHHDLTTQYGISNGSVYPQQQATTFKLGDKVKKGDTIKYNSGFFKPSRFNKHQVMWKAGVIAKTALMEASYTLEDSSAIDDWLADQLKAPVTKVKTVVVRADQTIKNLVKVGDTTDIESILCTIVDANVADSGLFNEKDLDTLRLMGSPTPRAGVVGKVEKIEVFYHGDPDDMSDSLLEIVQSGDKDRRKKSKRLGKNNITGQVDQSLRIDGNGLDLDHVAIKIYITYVESMGVGDKAVFCNQMKTVIGHRLSGINETESGVQLNAIFGAKSVIDRIVLSALIMGMSIAVQTAIGEKAAEMWMSNDKP